MADNYFFFDGSALCAQIRTLQRKNSAFVGRKLDPVLFVGYLQRSRLLQDLHGGAFRRAAFYFPTGDEGTVADYLTMPKRNAPGLIRDIYFKYCGKRIRGSKAFDFWVEEKVPAKWQERFSKSEKGIDTEICCDALKLVTMSKLDRLFLLTNDADFVPLFKTLKDLGTNVSLLSLSEFQAPNDDLLREADAYDVVPIEILQTMFLPALKQES